MLNHKKTTAVIIGNGNFESLPLANNYIKFANEIIVLDSAIEQVITKTNVIPNVVIGDLDGNFDIERIEQTFPNVKIIHEPDQEKTDFEKAIEYLIKNNYSEVYGFCLTGKRMDHTFNNISSLAKYNQAIDIKIIDNNSTIFCIDSSSHFKKMYDKDTIISLLPIGTVSGITTKNLEFALNNEKLELGIRTGSSNKVLKTDFVEIEITKGKLIIMECID